MPFELIDTDLTSMAFALQHAKSHQAAGDVMPLRLLRTRLTASALEWVFAHTDYLFNLGAVLEQTAYFGAPYLTTRTFNPPVNQLPLSNRGGTDKPAVVDR
jgi:hypothetical protein